ncbi:sensor histidine kinase [Rathayibacter rathayi]|uniref:histidine kinase n=1 Tax=Rathayibacter rathayi TaxID=33887 RepID=A0ABD6W529_RATRA|nr:HAMP domain-containing sensor histidine kinase [Rathayibacter rathayi]AZZ49833.1 sensor histidine kinase [Rathayibacter rathayi]MWV75661.1 HAMP domain-containing protein [Rathayibacter rathayi NCPPB 2980 = VKM Ac-1601]PPF09876.1 sensor histidine kinase [Rathayibacter rathayi]PPF19065.1 sensor histidine kinase [Rathayibacter rathayi]PPF42157.1 sensor histidine kinase [Rathayibacter rathayi]
MSRAQPGALRTGSLRLRTVLAVLALLAVLLLALSATVQAVLGERLRDQIEERLQDRASTAAALVGSIPDDTLASRLSAQGVSVRITSPEGEDVVAGPSPEELRLGPGAVDPLGEPPSPPGPSSPSDAVTPRAAVTVVSSSVSADAELITLESTLSDGTRLELTSEAGSVGSTLAQLNGILLAASAVFLLLAALALIVVVRATLRPLERMTDVARDIAHGDRGRRLRPSRPRTELGRTATAFDEMLDDLEQAERTALAAEATALAAEQRMRAFVSDAAHELRTPVAGIQAAADALVRADGGEQERERLSVHVVRESLRAGRLIQDMLLMARLDEGLTVKARPLDPAGVAEAAVERQELRCPGLAIRLHRSAELPLVSADADRLGQVLGNLLENGARFARSQIDVSVEADPDSVSITVDDDGPGIAEADRERVFDRLVRLDDARNRADGGSGLGLPIARGLARAFGGDLVAQAGPVGARFRVTLPRAAE